MQFFCNQRYLQNLYYNIVYNIPFNSIFDLITVQWIMFVNILIGVREKVINGHFNVFPNIIYLIGNNLI